MKSVLAFAAGAILAVSVAISGEWFSTGRANEVVHCLPLHQMKVAVPPPVAAGIRAELFLLPSGILYDGLSTTLAGFLCRSGGFLHGSRFSRQPVPVAERFYSAFAYTSELADLFVSESFLAILYN